MRNKFGGVMYDIMTIVNSVLYVLKLLRADLKSSYHKENLCNYVRGW